MTREQIAARLCSVRVYPLDDFTQDIEAIIREAEAAARAEEREACAKVCNEIRHPNYSAETSDWISGTVHCAEAIRARGETT
jgi:DNA-binding IclR family transcriptional regulator